MGVSDLPSKFNGSIYVQTRFLAAGRYSKYIFKMDSWAGDLPFLTDLEGCCQNIVVADSLSPDLPKKVFEAPMLLSGYV